MSLTKKINLPIAMGLVLALMLMFGIALAQTETIGETTSLPTDIPEELVSLAQDLGCETNAQCALKFDANIEQGIILAQKYDIYTPEQEKLASTFKTEVLERLRTVNQDNFEEEILALANKILSEKPALAKIMSVTRQEIDNAKTIINTVKDAGVDIRTCQKSPEELSRAQLIACVRASNDLSNKEKSAGDYIPKENAKAEEMGRMLDLENSLLAGEYTGLGKIGVEEAGQICLKPGSESIADCDQIAQRFFGAEGVQELQKARQQTTRIKEYYTEGIEKMELVTPDGQKLIGKDVIRNTCDKAFEESNLGLARACGNFAVKNGYATQNEIEEGLKIMETFSQRSQGTNFDDCRFNPESCREFLPDEFRGKFDSQFEIFKIMSESIGFDPARCENNYDSDIGKRCLEGAKRALSQVEEIAKNSPEARRIVDEIKSHVTEGERMTNRLDEFHQDSGSGGMAGPGGCREPEECFKYCNQPTNSAECISFGAKSQIFEQNSIVQRFNIVNEQFNTPQNQPYPTYPYPPQNNDNFPNTFQNQGDQIDPGFNRYPYQPREPSGPNPECFAAIESGDFAKAKIACSSTTVNYPRPIAEPFPICPTVTPSPCPEGQMRQMASDSKNCPTYSACTVIENYKPIDIKPCPTGTYWDSRSCVTNPIKEIKNTCPMMPTINSCPTGQEKYETYNSPECGTYYSCRDTTTRTPCPTGTYWDGKSCMAQPITRCTSDQWWDGATQSCKSSQIPTVGSCNYSTQYWKPSISQCMPRTNCTDTINSEYNSQECQGVRGMTMPINSGCGTFTTQATCQASSLSCGWANGACGGNTMTNTACTMGQYWNGSTCVNSSTTGQCPSGQYWFTPPSGGMGYCMSTSTSDCTSGQYWNGSACVANSTPVDPGAACALAGGTWNGSSCQMPTSTPSCPSGQSWNGSMCAGSSTTTTDPSAGCAQAGGTWNTSSNYCQMPTSSNGSGSSCSSGQYWNGTSCVNNTTPTPSSSSSDMATGCAQAGGSWNGSSCQMPTTSSNNTSSSSSSSDPATMCAQAGGTWDGSTCVMAMLLCNQTGGNWTGAACNLAKNISEQKAYNEYYQKQTYGLLAQIIIAFTDLFR